MRRDYIIAMLLAISAIPTGAALMAAPLKFEHLPIWAIDLCFFGGIILTFGLIVGATVVALHAERPDKPEEHRMIAIVGMVVFGVGFLTCTAWYFWPLSTHNVPHNGTAHIPTSSSGLLRFVVECEPQWPPSVIHAGETYAEMQIYHGEKGGLALIRAADKDLPSLHETDDMARMRLPMPWRCVVSYYGGSTLVDVTIQVHLIFQRAVRTSTGYSSGDTTLITDWEVHLSQIGPSSNKWTFYIFNISPEFVHFNFSGYATGRRIENSTPEQIEVIWPYKETRGFFLVPDQRAMK